MKRLSVNPRLNWTHKVEKVGLTYHTHETESGPKPYWDEAHAYELSADEVDVFEGAINELHRILIEAADAVVQRGWWDRLAIPEHAIPFIQNSWDADDFSLYGRFDLAWAPGGQPKALEYNADTPTSLVEAAVAQWYWLQDRYPGADQFNSIHERLIEAWKRFATTPSCPSQLDFLSVGDNLEDDQTVSYLMDTAQQAGLKTRWSAVDSVGYDARNHAFVTSENAVFGSQPIAAAFKLYPWEWMFHEEFGIYLRDTPVVWIEPPWKALLSNKAILAVAWELFPEHPNLLPTYFSSKPLGNSFVQKPKLSREGANVSVVREGDIVASSDGDYGEDGYVFQAIAPMVEFEGVRPVFGGWVVDHEAAGLGIRESDGLITDNVSRFVPHFFRS